MYENKTSANIHAKMLNNLPAEVDKCEGEVAYDLTMPVSMSAESLFIELDTVLALAFADTAASEWLELRTKELGVNRKPSAPMPICMTGCTPTFTMC